MPDGTEPTPPTRSRRGQLTVAELLARHAADTAPARDLAAPQDPVDARPAEYRPARRVDDELPEPRRAAAPAPAAPEVTDQFTLEPAGLTLSPSHAGRLGGAGAVGGAARGIPDPDEAPTAQVPRIPATESARPRSASEPGAPASGSGRSPAPDGPDQDGPDQDGPDQDGHSHPERPDALDDREHELALRARRIDESLVRLTAIHAGMGSEMSERVSRSSRLPVVNRDAASADADGNPGDDRSRHGNRARHGDRNRHGGRADRGRPGGVAGLLADRPPTGLVRVARVALVALAVVAFLATGVGWGTKAWLDGKLRPVAALDPNSDSIVDKAGQDGDLNYLLVGSDTRAGVAAGPDTRAEAAQLGSAKAVPGARSDTVMLAHIPAKRDRVVLVSFPVDLQVDRPNCDRWDQAGARYPGGTSPAESGVKLNSAFEIGGPRCVTKVMQKLTGLSINHFTAIDFAGFKEMVDAVQGVPICLERPVVDSVLGQVVPTSGRTVLAGEQALAFVRARNVRGDPTSDYGRIERQQRFLSALLRKGLSEQVLLNPGRLSAFVGAFGAHTLSDNAGLDELSTLAGSLRNLDPAKITFVTVPTVGEANAAGNEVLRTDDATALFAAIRADQPLPGEAGVGGAGPTAGDGDDSAPRVAAGDTVAPSRVTMAVRNGSSRAGLATQVADSLRSVGFTVDRVGDAEPSEGGESVIRHSADLGDQAATVAAAVPGAVTRAIPGPPGLLELVLGENFDGEVKAAAVDNPGALSADLSTVNAADDSCR